MQKSVQVRTPLYAAAYWQQAADEFKNIRVLAFAGMVTALAIILESFPIYLLGQSLKIYFSFVVVSLGCACYGPLVGMGVGAVIDTLGFLLSSYGEPYFPGYLITAMLSGLIYGVMLYQRKPTIPRLIVTRLLINYGSNVLLGSVWKAMLYGSTASPGAVIGHTGTAALPSPNAAALKAAALDPRGCAPLSAKADDCHSGRQYRSHRCPRTQTAHNQQ